MAQQFLNFVLTPSLMLFPASYETFATWLGSPKVITATTRTVSICSMLLDRTEEEDSPFFLTSSTERGLLVGKSPPLPPQKTSVAT